MDLGISGRVALVAGASQGIGRAVATALAREGVDVALLARDAEKLANVAAEIRGLGRRAVPLPVDVTDRAALRSAVEQATDELGAPGILVHAVAAVWEPRKLQYQEDDEIDRLLRTDLLSAIDLARLVLPAMTHARFGRIVTIGSLAARTGVAGGALYAAGKAALEGLVRGIALDDSRRGITANAVSLGFVDTERLRMRTAGGPEARERLERATATRRITTPEEVADVVAFLCSERARAITGAVVDVTAGGHLNNLW
jgi:NAD(P)-dependent dehydrogenase (short-subunit alcohol dehydrogenase family)